MLYIFFKKQCIYFDSPVKWVTVIWYLNDKTIKLRQLVFIDDNFCFVEH